MNDVPSKILVIVNPVSGQGDIDEALAKIEKRLTDLGITYDLKITEGEGDALNWAREAKGYDRILAAGGDGTVMEAMSGAIENELDIPLGQIPLGTANLLARALGVPTDLEKALTLALETGVVTKMDTGYLPNFNRYFALLAGAGWDAEMIDDADREMKDHLGFIAYVISGIRHFFTLKRSQFRVTIDGKEKRFRAHTLAVINVGEIYQSKIAIGKNVSPHDGKLDLAVVAMKNRLGLLRLIYRLITKKFDGSKELRYYSATHIKVEATPPMKLEIDGESIGETPFEVEVISSGAHLIVPRDYVDSKQVDFEPLKALLPVAKSV